MKPTPTALRTFIGKSLVLGLTGALLLACLWMSAPGQAKAADQKFNLKFASAYAALHPSVVNGITPWIEEMKQKSGGRIIVQYFAPGTLGPASEHWETVKNGIADLCFETTGTMFPLSEAVSMPFMFKSTEASSRTRQALLEQFPEMAAEYNEVKLLWGHCSAPYELHLVKKKVTSLEDIKGLRIVVWTTNGRKFASALGVVPQDMHSLDTYMALQRGMADGVFCPVPPMRSVKVDEVTKYHNLINFAQDAFWGVMNKKSFEKLPPDLQKLMVEMTGDKMATIIGRTLDDGIKPGIEAMKAKGHEFIEMPDAEMAKWRAQVKPIYEEWITSMEAKGHKNARKMFDTALELGKKFQAEKEAR